MSNKPPIADLMAFAPRPRDFGSRVRKLAMDSKNIKWGIHARDRMSERDIPIRVALTVLREGTVLGDITAGKNPGEWKGKIVLNVKGRRDVGVVTILVRDDHIKVKTVEWEDIR